MPIYMPGMSNNFDVNGMIKKIMKSKQGPLKRIEKEIARFDLEKDIWKLVRKKLNALAGKAKRLYDHTNPFREMVAKSGDKESFTAKANRKARKGKRTLQVLRLASAHTIISDSLQKDKRISGSVFYIKVGKKEVKIDFSDGGTLKEFSDLVEKMGKDIVKVVLTYDTADTAIMMIQALKMGSGNELQFRGSYKTLLEAGFLVKGGKGGLVVPFKSKGDFEKYRGLPPGKDLFGLSSGVLTLEPGTKIERDLPRTFKRGGGWKLRMEVKVDPIPRTAKNGSGSGSGGNVQNYDPSSLNLGPGTSVSIEGIRIFGGRLLPNETDVTGGITNKKPKDTTLKPPADDGKPDYRVLALVDKSAGTRQEFRITAPSVSGSWQKIEVDLAGVKGLSDLSRLAFINGSGTYRVSCRNLRFEAKASGKYQPKREISKAQDSLLKIDGIKVRRKTNKIDDLVDGVTINLHRAGKPADLKIDHDRDLIKKYIYEFLETYNKTLKYLNNVTKYMTPDERKKQAKMLKAKTDLTKALEDKDKAAMEAHKGKLSGNMHISRLKYRLRRMMGNPYKTRLGKVLILLSQMGISTGAPNSKWSDLKKNAGAIELDTNKLRDMIDKDVIAVAQILGYDSNGDGRPDSGAAWAIYELTRYYTRPGNSIITVKLKTLDMMMKYKRQTKEREERRLKSYEERLRRKWASSETRQNQYKAGTRWLNNQNGQK